jgi:hypothetical protein
MSMHPPRSNRRWGLVIGSGLGVAMSAALIWLSNVPLGVPGEWTWDRIPFAAGDLLVRIVPALVMLPIYVGVVWAGGMRFSAEAGRIERTGWVAGLCLVSAAWLFQLAESAPAGFGTGKAAWVLYYPGPSGYFTAAKTDPRPAARFLREYADEMSRGDVLHIGTHPPGLTLAFRALIAVCESSPALRSAVRWTEPDSVSDAFADLAANTAQSRHPLQESDRAVIWLAALLVYAAALLAMVPLYSIVADEHSPLAGWFAAAMWPLVPAVVIFAPKSDVLLAFCGLCLMWSWRRAVVRSSCVDAGLAAIIGWLSLQISLAMLPVGLACVLWSVWRTAVSPVPEGLSSRHAWKQLAKLIAAGGCVFVLLSAAAWVATGWNVMEVWSWNLRNHGRFYGEYARTYWAWLLVNPVELAISAGPPVFITAVVSLMSPGRSVRRLYEPLPGSLVVVWVLLWLSGKNMGEAARLWILLLPWLLMTAALRLADSVQSDRALKRHDQRPVICLLLLQAMHAVVTVGGVVGFHVPGVG